MAEPLPALLVDPARSSHRVVEEDTCLPDPKPVQASPSKSPASPSNVVSCAAGESLRRLDEPGKARAVVRPADAVAGSASAELDVRVGRPLPRRSSTPRTASTTKSAASTR